ncbi:MAG TPA: sterol-binding protein [Chromatiales bacterium]|nr:sterol-binding protein [Chromatiales bacterium]
MDRLTDTLAALVNRGIRESASARGLAGELDGKSLRFRIEPPGIALRLRLAGGKVLIDGDRDQPTDAELTGSPLDFNRLLIGDTEAELRAGTVELRGDTEVADRFRDLLFLARPDFEELLSRLIGDVAAHQLGEGVRQFADWGKRAARSFGRSLTEYLQEERKTLPTRYEVEEFASDVDRFGEDVDRLAARIDRLAR